MRAVAIFLIHVYQRTLSPWTRGSCRHLPSCSAYAAEAIDRYGVVRGGGLALRRVLRCHPLGTSGFDPVPELHGDRHADLPDAASRAGARRGDQVVSEETSRSTDQRVGREGRRNVNVIVGTGR